MNKKLIILLSLMTMSFAFSQNAIKELQDSLRKIAENESKAVVFISTEKTIKQNIPTLDPFDFFFGFPDQNNRNRNRNQEREFKQTGLGSGVIYQKKGNDYFIITNNHVVEGADKINITIDGIKQYKAEIIGSDPYVDIALIKVSTPDNLQSARFGDSNDLRTGDFVVAIGNPFGLSQTVTFGIVSAVGRGDLDRSKPGFTNFIQTDAAINPGNSGGPLLNINGEVIGINTMIYSQSGGNIGIGFAVPINVAKNVAEQLINKGKIEHGWIGVQFKELNKDDLEKLGIKNQNFGMLVLQVVKNGPADKGGIKSGDILIKVNNIDLLRSNDLTMIVGNTTPGEKLAITFIREGKSFMKYVTVEKRDEKKVASAFDEKSPDSGKSSEKYGFSLNESKDGVVVTFVENGSISNQAGFRKGDIIYRINDKIIKTVKDFNSVTGKDDGPFYFYINRNGDTLIILM